ncbi:MULTISPECIES: Hpt domain-containing protein [unclassified Pseudomonas]|uniref:Hpt domain-containing protein n=1 Tax=unclassified Pseudomonas TaxID=196821 RepID=UPI001320182F|nr:Hpt domain-containing protein [Pseudomonas sp. R84]QHC94665.1 histidine kinase [Pseudomonas sp. R84]
MTDIHVDREVLDTLRDVMEDSYPDLLDTFLSDSKIRLEQLQETADAKELSEVAHSFKGSASNMGAVRLATLCQELESNAKDKSPAEIVRLVADISVEFAEVRSVYEDERQHATTH